jgi:hypothetical protein
MVFIDARIPVIFGMAADAGPNDALLCEGEGAPAAGRDWFLPDMAPGHPADCACCTPRNGAGQALARLMLARGRGTGMFFNRVIVVALTEGGRATACQALASDPIASACFRVQASGEGT